MIVPIVFLAICVAGFFLSGLPLNFLFNEMIFRLSRNLILVMSLIIPVITGMGLNFGIVLGAMAGQIGLIFIMNYGIGGIGGFLVAILVSTPFAIFFGYLVGKVLNKAKGKEMITSMILGFFANGIYQLVFIVLAGKVIPFSNPNMLMPTGVGLRNTIDLITIRKSLDSLIFKNITPYPIVTLIVTALLFVALYFFLKTKLGQEMRAVGQSMNIAGVSGINVDRTRIIAIIISTVLAAWGQIVYLQNMGTLNTFNNHEQVGLFAVASLLIGGASVNKASWKEALIGTFLFHLLFIISPLAGQNLMGNAQIGEYFRVFIAYGVIGLALLLHAWEQNKIKTQLSDI
ncbi:ABC transporter permease [Tissierella praeacuta]|uniref:ABC transporter permease subunit n=1 Tax=Tissierella praeacuta TaxID=43131 RepID=UPI0033409697